MVFAQIGLKKKDPPICPEFWYGLRPNWAEKKNTLCRNSRPRLACGQPRITITFRFQSTETRQLVAPNHHYNEDNNDRLYIFSVRSSSEDQLQNFRYYMNSFTFIMY